MRWKGWLALAALLALKLGTGVLLIAGIIGPARAQATAPEDAQAVQPWTEALVSVADLAAWESFFTQEGGWRVMQRGRLDPRELRHWQLPAAASARFVRLCAPQASTGCIRFVRFAQAGPQRPIRLAARPWDTGGIFSLMVRSDDVQALFDSAVARGWWAESEPYRFSFGGSDLVNVVLTGPHGINLAVYQRRNPPFTAFPVGRLSQAFNSMRMVADQPRSLAFYRQVFGFALQFDADYLDRQPGPSNFSIPHNLTPSIPRRAAVVYPMPGETGRIEVMQFVGFTGKDVSAHAKPPNFGILSVRYPVVGLDAWLARITARGARIAYGPSLVTLPPHGAVRLVAITGPDGDLTEFYEPVGR